MNDIMDFRLFHQTKHKPCDAFRVWLDGWTRVQCWKWAIIHKYLLWWPNEGIYQSDIISIYMHKWYHTISYNCFYYETPAGFTYAINFTPVPYMYFPRVIYMMYAVIYMVDIYIYIYECHLDALFENNDTMIRELWPIGSGDKHVGSVLF